MDKVLEKHNLPKLNQEEIENINRSITNMEIKSVIKHLSANKSLGPDVLTGKFYQNLREQLTPKTYPIQTLPKNCTGGTLPNSFCEAMIRPKPGLMPKPGKDNMKKRKLQANITDEHRCKNPQQNSSKQNSTTY